MTDKKTPQPRLVKLKTGEQLVALVYIQKDSDFIRLQDPYKIELHPYDLLGDYIMEEKMTIKPWMFKSKDKVFSVHKNHIITLGVPTDDISEYYHNMKSGAFKQNIDEIKKARAAAFNKLLDQANDEEYLDMRDYHEGKKTIH